VEEILHQAEQVEKKYDWLGAAGSYEKALKLLPEDGFSKKAEFHERLGYAHYRAAFQAESNDDFRARIHKAVEDYGKAKEFYGMTHEPGKAARILRCDAMTAQAGYWLASEAQEKKKLTDECWALARDCLKAFEMAGDTREYGRTYNLLSACIDLGFFFEQDCQTREKTMKEAVECGERAVKFLPMTGDVCELARAYVKTATFLYLYGYLFLRIDERDKKERYSQKALNYWLKGSELSEEVAMLELPSVLFGTGPGGFWGDGTDAAVRNLEKALEYSRKTRDKFILGRATDSLAYHNSFRATGTEDPDRRVELLNIALEYAEQARNMYSSISFTSPRGGVLWTGAPYPQYYWGLARDETNPNKKRELFEKALEAAPILLKSAQNSGYIDIIAGSHLLFGCILRDLASVEEDSTEKKKLLENALVHGNESVRLVEQVSPLSYWDRYLTRGFVGSVRHSLADLEEDAETKKKMLQEVLLVSEESLRFCIEGAVSYVGGEGSPLAYAVGGWRNIDGGTCRSLYELTKDKKYLTKAAEAFEDAARWFQRLDSVSRIAECYWKAAQTYDALDDHLKAAEKFRLASDNYRSAAEKIPQLKSFYQDHAVYMQAWTEIEKARHHHERQEYGLARENFEKAANLHRSLKKWSYLAPNYSAWANVEYAEDLSRKEQCEEAVQAFEQALKLFNETRKSIQNELNKIEDPGEKQMATSMVKATDIRHEYCSARIALEEAKIFDKKGDHHSSSEKYRSAAETFEEIGQALETDQERRELSFITSLSRAWQKMTQAEAETSPTLYEEASSLFEKAKEFSPNEQAKMLVLGHSRFCKALMEGTKFVDTRDANMHAVATKYLESAANYYVSAGFQKASEYAKATQLLFDAYVQMDNAKRESDPEKKARLYMMTEKVLQTSAGSFMKAEHPEKRERVLRLLGKVEEERELAISLNEVLHAPSIVSSTAVFRTPPPTHEEAVGSERFEHADVQANLIIRQKELKIGENLNIELEMVNAGKGSALLTKVTEIIPKGFELAEKPDNCRVEDSYINLKGKRLDPLKTEEVQLVLKPTVQGTFSLKPTVLYLDENGKYKSHEPEPVLIVVKELGIKSWLKGER
jgi:tetratricopeptide (TPR) repeat protein